MTIATKQTAGNSVVAVPVAGVCTAPCDASHINIFEGSRSVV
jgi:hypothetical protein